MKTLRKLYGQITRDRWEIGFVEGGLEAVMEQETLHIHWLKHGYRDRWFADPFVLDVTASEIRVLVEEFRYATGKGRIALLVVDKTTYELKSLDVVLELDTHLSFPAIWRENGEVYVYPESWQTGMLCLYELNDCRCDAEKRIVFCEEPMADAIITNRFGKANLFSVQRNDKLRVYDLNPTSGLFELSYVKPFERATARNAGDFFEYKGRIYRPAQVCEEQYGEAVEIQEVICDSNESFCFVPCKTLCSCHPSLDTGLHTLNCFKGVAAIDVHGWSNALTVKTILALKKILLWSG